MAGIQLNELPETPTVEDDDIFHLQTDLGFVDKKVTKQNFLQEIQSTVDSNSAALTNSITVVPLTGGGSLLIGRVNDMQDSGTYLLPPANSVPAETFLDAMISDEFATGTPVVQRVGGDTIIDSQMATWTEVIYDVTKTITIRYISDGISRWRIA